MTKYLGWCYANADPYWETEQGEEDQATVARMASKIESLTAENERLRSGLKLVRQIICEGAITGFNPLDGGWAERLFESQSVTYRLVEDA